MTVAMGLTIVIRVIVVQGVTVASGGMVAMGVTVTRFAVFEPRHISCFTRIFWTASTIRDRTHSNRVHNISLAGLGNGCE